MTDPTTQIVLEAVTKQKFRKANVLAQEHLLDFCEATYSGYHRAEHLVLVAEALEETKAEIFGDKACYDECLEHAEAATEAIAAVEALEL